MEVAVHDHESFRSSTDRKTAPYARPRKGKGPFGAEALANAFGLPSGPDYACEHATEWCWPGTCYGHALEMFPGVKNLLMRNWAVFQKYQDDLWGLSTAMDPMLDVFELECEKRGVEKVFRWFWDGDIPSENFARAMRLQAVHRPGVKFWVYTRNHEAVPFLFQSNLTVYFSVDRYNVDHALALSLTKLTLKFAFCGDSWEETEELARRFPGERSGPRCPEITGKVPLIVWDKQGEIGRGACVECGMCITGINNVRFSSQKVKHNELPQPVRLTRRASHVDQ